MSRGPHSRFPVPGTRDVTKQREVPTEVDVNHGVPLLAGHIETHRILQDPRVVDRAVHAPIDLDGIGEEFFV